MIHHDKHLFQGWHMLNHQPVINQSLSSLFPQSYHIYPVIFSVISGVTTTISLGANNHQSESKMPIQAVILFFVSSFLYHQPVIFFVVTRWCPFEWCLWAYNPQNSIDIFYIYNKPKLLELCSPTYPTRLSSKSHEIPTFCCLNGPFSDDFLTWGTLKWGWFNDGMCQPWENLAGGLAGPGSHASAHSVTSSWTRSPFFGFSFGFLGHPTYSNKCWLAGWNHGIWFFIFFHSVGHFIIPTVTHSMIFQRGRYTTNQVINGSKKNHLMEYPLWNEIKG